MANQQRTIAANPRPMLPEKIEREQVLEAVKALGLDPHAVVEVHLHVASIWVEWATEEDSTGRTVTYDAHLSGGKRTPAFGDTFERVQDSTPNRQQPNHRVDCPREHAYVEAPNLGDLPNTHYVPGDPT